MDGAELRNELEKHHRESYGWALACCRRNPSDAENILQTAYLKVLDGKARFDGRSAFKTWFFSVIRVTAIDHRRREMLGRLRLFKHEASSAGATGEFDEAVFRSEVQSSFRQAIVELPRRQQEVLQLVFYHDLTLAEAAGVMGIGVGSARTHYERGKKRLRRLMAKLGIYDESELARQRNQAVVP
ncbi:MAG TPA: RNA polymerase sigma factor [Blastocatellia bacterium]|nr:RNA polymerase sigma factor [Blastocatellia bacterium]